MPASIHRKKKKKPKYLGFLLCCNLLVSFLCGIALLGFLFGCRENSGTKKTRSNRSRTSPSKEVESARVGMKGKKGSGGSKTLNAYLQDLSSKNETLRGSALVMIVQGLTEKLVKAKEFLEKNCGTLAYWLLRCMEKKSDTETLLLALRAIGLQAIAVTNEDSARELRADCLFGLRKVMTSGSEVAVLKAIDCLAIVTFFGAGDQAEKESAMQVLWKFLDPDADPDAEKEKDSGSANAAVQEHSAAVVAKAISAWSFLLTAMEAERISKKYWTRAVSYFMNLREESEDSLLAAAAEALTVILNTGCIEKFSSHDETVTCHEKASLREELKEDIVRQLRCPALIMTENGDEGEEKGQSKTRIEVLEFLEEGERFETHVRIGRGKVKLSSLSQILQLKFIKLFLGEDGFVKHIRENEKLQGIFEFTRRGMEQLKEDTLYVPEREEVAIQASQHRASRKQDHSMLAHMDKADRTIAKKNFSENSSVNKARTRLLNKQRMASKEDDMGTIISGDETGGI